MKEYTVKVTRQARDHLHSIKAYIANELLAPDTAKEMIALLKNEIKSLSVMPERIKLTEEESWGNEGIRRMRVKNYYVYFWIDETNDLVHVIAVIYVACNQSEQLEKIEKE